MKYSSIPKSFVHFWHSKKVWRKPRKAEVLIYDRAGSEALLTYIDPKSVAILDVRGESLNLYVLFKCFSNWKLSQTNYIVQYLKCVKASVVLTFVDNSPAFYLLKNHQKHLITVFVQNGWRTETGDVFGFLKNQTKFRNKYKVDYMFVFGDAIGREYSKYIDGTAISIGSFRNNLYEVKTHKTPKSVLFISQYRPPPSPESKPIYIYENRAVLWKQFYSAEEFLLPLLQTYCLQNELELKICMYGSDQTKQERNYFRSLLENETFELLKRSDPYSSYKNVDAAGVVVFVDTTLGYEALARGKKTAAFTLRGKLVGSDSFNFGWPADLPEKGPFWSNYADEGEVERVMDYITTVNNVEWEQTSRRYVSELIEYDLGNTRFLDLMRELDVPLKRKYKKEV